MRFGLFGMIFTMSVLGLSGAAAAETPFEQRVLAALNHARSNPAALVQDLRQYRGYFRGKLVRYPGQGADLETDEGLAAVDEAIAFLARQAQLTPVSDAPLLHASADDLVADQARDGGVGHAASDGTLPGDRALRHGGGRYVAEVIAYGSIDPADVVRQLIVDDGVPDRGHREILYSPELRFAGVACGPHPEYRLVCVIDLGITPDGHVPGHQGTAQLR